MRIVFMGTPEFAVSGLIALSQKHEIVGVFTQPDKPAGRGYALMPPPVKISAESLNIPVFQPSTVKDGAAFESLKNLCPEAIVVIAYGKILPESILTLPKFGCINVHASLLPKFRGASPIQWSIISGETETGVTTMQMDAGLDTGDILLKSVTEIKENETAGELHDRLSQMGADLICKTLKQLEAGLIEPIKQDDKQASFTQILTKQMALINWEKPAKEINNMIRGFNPWPVAHTKINGRILKIFSARIGESSDGAAGEVVDRESFTVCCGDGVLLILNEIQLEGKKKMSKTEFLRGYPLREKTVLGE